MATVLADRVKETSTTTGTGTLSLLGAVTNFVGFVAGVGDANTTYYAIVHQTLAEWEVGQGVVTDAATDTLSRAVVLASSNAGALVNFSAGTKDVWCDMPAVKILLSGDAITWTASHIWSVTLPMLKITDPANGGVHTKIGIVDAGGGALYTGIWFNKATPDITNYSFLADGDNAVINSAAGGTTSFRVGNSNALVLNADLTATLLSTLILATGTTLIAPLKYVAGTKLTSAIAGGNEFDGTQYYQTIDTTSGRGIVPVEQYFFLDANGGTISTIANFFGSTSNISLVASAYYEIEIFCWFLNTTAGTIVWTFTNSAAPTKQNIHFRYSPIGGVNTGAGSAAYLEGDIVGDATAAKALTVSGTLTDAVNHYAHFKIWLKNGSGTSLKIQATKAVGGTITPLVGSYYKARRLPTTSTGTFAA